MQDQGAINSAEDLLQWFKENDILDEGFLNKVQSDVESGEVDTINGLLNSLENLVESDDESLEIIHSLYWHSGVLSDDFETDTIAEKNMLDNLLILNMYDSEISDAEDDIRLFLKENVDHPEVDLSPVTLQNNLINILMSVFETELLSSTITGSLLSAIGNNQNQLRTVIRKHDLKSDVCDFLQEMNLRYEFELHEKNKRYRQGPHYWKQIDSELVVRQSNSIGINYQMNINDVGKTEITTNLQSNIILAEKLIQDQIRAIDQFDTQAVEQVSEEDIYSFLERATELKETFLEVREKGENNE